MIPNQTIPLDTRDWLIHQTGDGLYRLVSHEEELATDGYFKAEDLIRELGRQIEVPTNVKRDWEGLYQIIFAGMI